MSDLPTGIKMLPVCVMLMLSLASCSKIVESMLEKPTDALVDLDNYDGDIQQDRDTDQGDDTGAPDTVPEDTIYEVNPVCFDMPAVQLECDPQRDTCQNGTTPLCGEKCDQLNDRNADGCDPRCFFETKVCTWIQPFENPADIAVEGNLAVVADAGDHTIKSITISDGIVSVVAGLPGDHGYNEGSGYEARFDSPSGVELFFDSLTEKEYIIVSDTNNNRIRKIDISSLPLVENLAGNGGAATQDGSCLEDAQFNHPIGIATDGESIYISDSGSGSIRKIIDPLGEGCNVTTIAGPPYFRKPMGIAWNEADPEHLFIADEMRHIIVRIERDGPGDPVFIAGNPDSTGGSIERAQGAAAGFNMPTGIDSNGEILVVAETYRCLLREIEINPLCDQCWVTRLAGKELTEGCQSADRGDLATLKPTCVAFDKTTALGFYRVFFCDPGCHAVRIVK